MNNASSQNVSSTDQKQKPRFSFAAVIKVFLRKFFLLGGVCYLGICTMLFFLQKSMVYPATKSPVAVSESQYHPDQIREVILPVESDVELVGWYCLANAKQTPSTLAIVFPGNGGNRLNRVSLLKLLNQLGCDTLIFDYRGYGGSGGSPAEELIAADSHKVWGFAKNELGYSNERIVVLGQSLGGGVATRLVSELCQSEDPPAGLILQATFTSLVDAAKHRFPWLPISLLMTERYPSLERIPDVTCPLLIIHGRQDEIIPFSLGENLFAAAPANSINGVPKTFIELDEAGHNNIMYVALDQITQAKQAFLKDIIPSSEKVE